METTGIVNDIVDEIVTCGRVFRSAIHVRLGLPLPRLPSSIPNYLAQTLITSSYKSQLLQYKYFKLNHYGLSRNALQL